MSAAADIARQREGRGSVRAAIARLWHYIAKNRGYYTFWALLTLAYSGAFLGAPILSGRTIDAAEAWYRGEGSLDRVFDLAVLLAGVGVIGGLLRYFSRVLVFNAAREIEYEIRNDLYAHLQRLPQSFYFGQRTGDLMSRCVNDLNSVRLLLGPGLLSTLQTPILLIGALSVMLYMDWQLALLAFAPYPLFILIARTFGRGVHHWSIMVQQGLGDLSNQLQESISGVSVVKTYAMEPVMEKRFAAANQELLHRHLRLVRMNGLMPAITGLLPSIGLLLVFAVGGTKGISKGEFFTFAMLIYQLTFPTFIMGWVVALIQRGSAAMQRIDEILATEPSIADRPDMADVATIEGEIEFRGLTFEYPGGEREPALRDVTLEVPAGSTLGIVGPVGSGKSTLASVIPRLFEVEDGQVFIDGTDVNRIGLNVLRSSIAMVPQDSFLFSMTLAQNVAYGLAEMDTERVAQAVDRAQLTRDLAELPRGLATMVGERGVMLSGGQRQRTALARALALDPKILILDDTLSSVDAATEEAIQTSLAEVYGGRTVVIISHRISSVRDCDRIIVLEEGTVTEQGSHNELLLHGGFYSRLARQQALEAELEEDVALSPPDPIEPGGIKPEGINPDGVDPDATEADEALQDEAELGKAYDSRLLARLWPYVRPYWPQVVVTLLLVVPLFFLELAPAWIIKQGLDRAFPGEPLGDPGPMGPEWLVRFLEPPGDMPALAWLSLLYGLAAVTLSGLQFLNLYIMAWTGQHAMRDLRRDVFGHIQKLHMGFFDRYPVGRLVTRATNDVENVAEMFSSGIVALVTDVFKMIGFATVLFLLNPKLALWTFTVVPVVILIAVVFRLRVREAFRETRIRIARINATIQETITGMKVVQLFTRESRNLAEFDVQNGLNRDASKRSNRWDAGLFSSVEIAQNLTVAIILGYGVQLATVGTFFVFVDWMRRFFMPLRDLSAKYSVMQSSMASAERIFQLFDTEPSVLDKAGEVPVGPAGARGTVEFDGVWFAYTPDPGDEDWILRNVSFRVGPGQKAAFVGPTGAGKTSVIKLLTRLYEPQKGTIRVDGVDLRDLPQAEVRRRVDMVLQDVFLFSGTVAENIGLGREDFSREDLQDAARNVEADRFIQRLPQGYDTDLRERGTDLSAGQRQLLSFARAVAHGADILVLDEATSSIDTETEAAIQRGIHNLMQGKTSLVIAHRLSTIRDVDRIHVLHKGRIVEEGRHEELLALDGVYARLYRLQYQAQESAAAAS